MIAKTAWRGLAGRIGFVPMHFLLWLSSPARDRIPGQNDDETRHRSKVTLAQNELGAIR